MGTDVFALVTHWEPMVAAFRAAGGLDFYWEANVRQNEELQAAWAAGRSAPPGDMPNLLPYADEHDFWGGRAFMVAGEYYDSLRPHLPPDLRDPADAFVRMLYPDNFRTGYETRSNDLSVDAGAPCDPDVLYAMRPATVRAALDRAAAVPWAALARIGDRTTLPERPDSRYVPEYATWEAIVHHQREWLHEAATTDRGLVVIMSY
ncbi:hypothetical protein [Actinomadura sp. HBU206391]|uniref:hypothetical protein n=1 Tax=Actinomadura sp. HBU206391 TaxID=2731692 RepID=UPI00164F0557|nr:hypothetical protein [Actinomadura sp. HBU206391]MBC6461337.1 hypothetical protein [Actinomadura sp. HBU206391]